MEDLYLIVDTYSEKYSDFLCIAVFGLGIDFVNLLLVRVSPVSIDSVAYNDY
jgi:hypothetical protein